jgi:hypothetical protein
MVQDMLEPEYYLTEVEGVLTHFRDYNPTSIVEVFDVAHKLAERQPLLVVPLPFVGTFGETTEIEDQPMQEDSSIFMEGDRSNKRTIDQVHDEQHGIRRVPLSTDAHSPVSTRDVAKVSRVGQIILRTNKHGGSPSQVEPNCRISWNLVHGSTRC